MNQKYICTILIQGEIVIYEKPDMHISVAAAMLITFLLKNGNVNHANAIVRTYKLLLHINNSGKSPIYESWN